MQYIIDIPDELVTEHQLKLILTKEIKGGGCKGCKTRCIECTQISVKYLNNNCERCLAGHPSLCIQCKKADNKEENNGSN